MKNLNVPQPLAGGSPASRIQAAKAMAFTLALDDPELFEPELIAWKDRTTSMASPGLEGCSRSYGWRDYGISHDGRLEVDAGGEAIFIFTESGPCDSCAMTNATRRSAARAEWLVCLSTSGPVNSPEFG